MSSLPKVFVLQTYRHTYATELIYHAAKRIFSERYRLGVWYNIVACVSRRQWRRIGPSGVQCKGRAAGRGHAGSRRRRPVLQPRAAGSVREMSAPPPAQRRGRFIVDARRRRQRRWLRDSKEVQSGATRAERSGSISSEDCRGLGGRRAGGDHLRAVSRRRRRRCHLGTSNINTDLQQQRNGSTTGRRHPAFHARIAVQHVRPLPVPLQSEFHLPPQYFVVVRRKRK